MFGGQSVWNELQLRHPAPRLPQDNRLAPRLGLPLSRCVKKVDRRVPEIRRGVLPGVVSVAAQRRLSVAVSLFHHGVGLLMKAVLVIVPLLTHS